MNDPAALDGITDRLQMMVIVEWAAVILFVSFLVALAVIILGFVKSVKELRSRRVQPIINSGKALAKNGADMAKSLGARGKRIAEIGMHTLEAVEMRAHTTTKIVKGTIPEAKKMTTEVTAAADDVRDVMKQVERVTRAAQAAQGIRAAMKIFDSVKSVAKSVEATARSTRQS